MLMALALIRHAMAEVITVGGGIVEALLLLVRALLLLR